MLFNICILNFKIPLGTTFEIIKSNIEKIDVKNLLLRKIPLIADKLIFCILRLIFSIVKSEYMLSIQKETMVEYLRLISLFDSIKIFKILNEIRQ